jgi:hypothetical protein
MIGEMVGITPDALRFAWSGDTAFRWSGTLPPPEQLRELLREHQLRLEGHDLSGFRNTKLPDVINDPPLQGKSGVFGGTLPEKGV